MKEQLESLLATAVATLQQQGTLPADASVRIQLDRPRDKSHGDFATNLAMMLAKPAQMNPRALAEAIIAAIPANSILAASDIAGPGFIKDRKSTRLNSSHVRISYAVFCLKKKKKK